MGQGYMIRRRAYCGGGDDTPTNWLTFSSPGSFSVSVESPGWDGTMYYSTDTVNWNVWDGSSINSGNENELHLAGKGNTVVTGASYYTQQNRRFVISGSNVSCSGNVESLLNWKQVSSKIHPVMGSYCYKYLFLECDSLIQAPVLPSTSLTIGCYANMFKNCTSLAVPPTLPATKAVQYCYEYMFSGCTSLASAPELPATTLTGTACYEYMFEKCTSLTQAPELPATTLVPWGYSHMFSGTSIVSPPNLPATTLAERCYQSIFENCKSLTQVPDLPVTNLTKGCYEDMFSGCTSLTCSPKLPATTLADCCYQFMFKNCTSLTSPPTLPATELASDCYYSMFGGCTSLEQIPALRATTLESKCYEYMFYRCKKINISTTQDSTYKNTYRIPASGTGTTATNALDYMFNNTGGSFTGTPEINTTYYTSNTIVG